MAPTGMVPEKQMTPHVPLSIEEILEDVEKCRSLGAAMVHVHARDHHGKPTHRADYYAPIIEGIREIDPALVVCVSCSGRHVSELENRAEVLDLTGDAKPDMASLTLGSNNFLTQASVNDPDVIRGLAERMRARGIAPEVEVFEPGMVDFGRHLVSKGLLPEPCYVNVLLGNLGTSPLSPLALASFTALMPDQWIWGVAGIGRYQLDANALGIAAGGHVRVGLEDNIWFDRERTTLATNGALVERIVRIAELVERPIATPAQAREMLDLQPVASSPPAVRAR